MWACVNKISTNLQLGSPSGQYRRQFVVSPVSITADKSGSPRRSRDRYSPQITHCKYFYFHSNILNLERTNRKQWLLVRQSVSKLIRKLQKISSKVLSCSCFQNTIFCAASALPIWGDSGCPIDPRLKIRKTLLIGWLGPVKNLLQATQVTTASSQMDAQADALLRDVYHLVQNRENRLWFIDSEELKALQTDALIILCTASNELRTNAQYRLQQMPANQMDLRARWIKENKDLSKMSRLMRDNRAFLLFQSAFPECLRTVHSGLNQRYLMLKSIDPPNNGFLAADGGGMLNILPASKPLRLGFGGSVGFSLVTSINESWVIKSGIEFGGAGLVDQDSDVNEVELEFFAGMPIALRYLTEIWFFEGDLGPIAVGAAWRERPKSV